MPHLYFVALLLLLPWCGDLVTGEVANDFSRCKGFFFQSTPPQGISGKDYKPICQFYNQNYHFATLYNRQQRSALYSAYTVGIPDGNRPVDDWKYEPQLATKKGTPDMQVFVDPVDQNVIESQAVPKDYEGTLYTKGHLTPALHMRTADNREATFTLTNVVPQRGDSNAGPWAWLEQRVLDRFRAHCTGEMHVITGVLPFNPGRAIPSDTNRVSVPEYIWSAYCCTKYMSPLPDPVGKFFPTYAALGRNDPNSDDTLVPKDPTLQPQFQGYAVKEMTVNHLEKILKKKLKMNNLKLFSGFCG